MPSESADRRAPPAPAPEQEQLACPRCDSTNTKFCYYNNYNFSQPRHFCKSCRRYWTRGGTLRDIPVGGGTRKNAAKRSRILPPGNPSAAAAATTPAVATATATSSPPGEPLPGNHYFSGGGGAGSFTSLLNASGGLLGLGGLGLGIGPGFEESGFGPLGRPMWAFPEFGYMGGANGAVMSTMGNAGASGGGMMMHTWQMEGGGDQAQATGGAGFVGGECFSWPELAISTPGNGLK